MIVPNKFISLDDSILAKLAIIMKNAPKDASIRELYRILGQKFDTADQFLLAIDVLYVLGRVSVDFTKGTITYAD